MANIKASGHNLPKHFHDILFFQTICNTFALPIFTAAALPPVATPARMAESVDALVSNTNVRKDVPVRPRLRVPQKEVII